MPKHIRQNMNHREQEKKTMMEQATDYFNKVTGMRISTKQSMGWIVMLILLIIAAVLGAHYMGYMTIPGLAGKFQKAAPSAHLQYFFF